jgi:hypothetical protein
MTKYRKMPVVVEAEKFDGTRASAEKIVEWINNNRGRSCVTSSTKSEANVMIHTLEGGMRALSGDMVIRGVQGEFYPCKPDIFEETHLCDPTDTDGKGPIERFVSAEKLEAALDDQGKSR